MSNVLVVADYGQLCERSGCDEPLKPQSQRHRRPYLKRRFCSKQCSGLARRRILVRANQRGKAYKYVRVSSHPRADAKGYVPQHTLVAERKIGRFLRPYEVAHHLDGDGDGLNNDPENLLVVPASVNRWLPPLNMN